MRMMEIQLKWSRNDTISDLGMRHWWFENERRVV